MNRTNGLRNPDGRVRLKQGQTRRSELAVRAYRALYLRGTDDRRTAVGSVRRFVLQSRLEALLKILTPSEQAFYYHEVGVMTGYQRP